MGTRNRFNPCRPCCDQFEPPCSACDDTPPDPLPITLGGFYGSDWPYGGDPCTCPDIDTTYWADWIDTCRWRFLGEIDCGCYGSECTLQIDVGVSKVGSTINWAVGVFITWRKSYSVAATLWVQFQKQITAATIDCDAQYDLDFARMTWWGLGSWPPICYGSNFTCQLN